jgi:hypothetical protein
MHQYLAVMTILDVLNIISSCGLLGKFTQCDKIRIIHTPLIGYFVAGGTQAAKRLCVWHE